MKAFLCTAVFICVFICVFGLFEWRTDHVFNQLDGGINSISQAMATEANEANLQRLAEIPTSGDFTIPNTVTQPLQSVQYDTYAQQYTIEIQEDGKIRDLVLDKDAVMFLPTTKQEHAVFKNKNATVYLKTTDKILQFNSQPTNDDTTTSTSYYPMMIPFFYGSK